MSRRLEFPPLLTGIAVPGDPVAAALGLVREEVEPGSVFYAVDEATLRTAIVLAPEEPLGDAIRVSFAALLGANDAIGALGPPEVAVHLEWPDRLRVNGAHCGKMVAHASTGDPSEEPDWLVLGLEIAVAGDSPADPGLTPDRTTLHAEGCGDITVPDLVEAWARHMMNWLHIYLTDGFAPLHEEWRAKAHRLGETVERPELGTFIGLDERGGMLLKSGSETSLIPLTRILTA